MNLFVEVQKLGYMKQLNCYRNEATTETSNFWLRVEKDDQKIVLEDKDLEIIGLPIIKYGDSTVIMQHANTGQWVSYKVCTDSPKSCN